MQIRCQQCNRPFALGKETIHAALDRMAAEDLSYYSAQCPHCRRTNRVSRKEMERAAPDWRESGQEKDEKLNESNS